MLVLTDDRELAEQISKLGIACVGVAGESDAFFNGTDLVVEKPEKLELQELEKYLQRYHGLPVTIARSPERDGKGAAGRRRNGQF